MSEGDEYVEDEIADQNAVNEILSGLLMAARGHDIASVMTALCSMQMHIVAMSTQSAQDARDLWHEAMTAHEEYLYEKWQALRLSSVTTEGTA